MIKLMSHDKTKDELTHLMSLEFVEYGEKHNKRFVAGWQDKAKAAHMDVPHLANTQEEADKKMILHAVRIAAFGATTVHFSPDTDVLVLEIRR